MSSSDQFPDIPRTRDGALNWAADTDPVGPVTPELALVDPGLTSGGQINHEVTMSSMQFGDGTAFNAAEPAQAPMEAQPPVVPLQPIAPLAPPASAPEPAQPTPVEPGAMAVSDMRDVPLGTLVFRAGLLPEERLEEALQEGMKTGKRLGEILLERGWVSETDLGRLLAGQKGLPFVELDASVVDPTAPPLLHPEKARLHGALPIGFEGGVPVVAVADPSNDLVIENVRRALACEPALVVAGRDALHRAINQVYGADATEHPAPQPAPVADVAPTAPVVEPVAVAPVAEPAPIVEPVEVAPVLEPVAPVVEHVAPVVEHVAPVVEPVAPVVEPVAPVVEPVAPLVEPVAVAPVVEPVVAPVVEPVTPVAPEPVFEPVAPQPVQNGDGVWLASEAVAEPVAPSEPVVEPVAPEPFVPQPEAAPVVPAAQVPVAPEEPAPVTAEPVAAEPVAEPAEGPSVDVAWTVVLRLADDERVEVGSFAGEAEAVDGARTVVRQIGSEGSWPFFAGRFIRPEAIVSVDLVQLEVTRWLGSSARAAALGPGHQLPQS